MNTIRKFILLPVVLNLFDAVINKTTSATTGNNLSGEMKTFYSDYLIDMAEPLLVHDQFGQKHPIPKNGGKTIEFRKYDPLPKATTALTEGVTPEGQKLNMGVITTNVDHCFQKAGFDKKRLFYTQGDYGLFQCSEPCCQETFENETVIREMMERQEDMKIPTELLPVCPRCGKPMTMNLRSDNKFVEDEGWHRAAERYENFLRTREGQKILFLELGVGYNTPVIIKYPFWKMTAKNPNATYVCINQGQAVCPQEIERQAICIDADIGSALRELSQM